MEQQSAPDYSHWLTIATTIFLVWTILFVTARIWVKVTRNLSWALNDSVYFAAFIVGIAECGTIYLAAKWDLGDQYLDSGSTSVRSHQSKALYASQVLYILATGLSRCSGALFIGSLTRSKKQKMPSFVVAAIAVAWTIGSTCAIAVRGNLKAPWKVQAGSEVMWTRWLGVETSGLCLEVMIWCLSLTLIWGLQMRLIKRVKVIGLFAVRFLLIPIAAGRLYFLNPANNSQSAYAVTLSFIFTQAAMMYSLMGECMTCLKPFLQPFYAGYGLSTRHGRDYNSDPLRDISTELSHVSQSKGGSFTKAGEVSRQANGTNPKRRERCQPSSSHPSQHRRGATKPEEKLTYEGRGTVVARVEAQARDPRGQRKGDDEVELLQQDKLVIQQTTTLDQIEEMAPEPTPSMRTSGSNR